MSFIQRGLNDTWNTTKTAALGSVATAAYQAQNAFSEAASLVRNGSVRSTVTSGDQSHQGTVHQARLVLA